MADQSSKSVVNGVLGHLPPWPRQALNNSVIGMEQAYRQRKGLPLLTDEDIAALKAGEPMPWERGDGVPAPSRDADTPAPTAATPQPTAPTPPSAAPAAVAAPSAPKAGISPE